MKIIINKIRVVIVILLLSHNSLAAFKQQLSLYLTAQIGTHIQRIGIGSHIQNQWNNLYTNASATIFYNKKYYGEARYKFSGIVDGAILIASSKPLSDAHFFSFNRKTLMTILPVQRSIGYQMRWYIMPKHSTQRTATIYLQSQHYYLQSENDAFAFSSSDRYRTGNIAIGYFSDSFNLQLATQLFTGDTKHAPSEIVNERCYKNLSQQRLGKFSNGIFNLQFGIIAAQQQWHTSLGWDDERVRHFFQNRMVHETIWAKKLNPHIKHCAIPMLQQSGMPCLLQSDKHKKGKLYLQLGCNDEGLY